MIRASLPFQGTDPRGQLDQSMRSKRERGARVLISNLFWIPGLWAGFEVVRNLTICRPRVREFSSKACIYSGWFFSSLDNEFLVRWWTEEDSTRVLTLSRGRHVAEVNVTKLAMWFVRVLRWTLLYNQVLSDHREENMITYMCREQWGASLAGDDDCDTHFCFWGLRFVSLVMYW